MDLCLAAKEANCGVQLHGLEVAQPAKRNNYALISPSAVGCNLAANLHVLSRKISLLAVSQTPEFKLKMPDIFKKAILSAVKTTFP